MLPYAGLRLNILIVIPRAILRRGARSLPFTLNVKSREVFIQLFYNAQFPRDIYQ